MGLSKRLVGNAISNKLFYDTWLQSQVCVCSYVYVSLCHFVYVSLCHCVYVSLCHCICAPVVSCTCPLCACRSLTMVQCWLYWTCWWRWPTTSMSSPWAPRPPTRTRRDISSSCSAPYRPVSCPGVTSRWTARTTHSSTGQDTPRPCSSTVGGGYWLGTGSVSASFCLWLSCFLVFFLILSHPFSSPLSSPSLTPLPISPLLSPPFLTPSNSPSHFPLSHALSVYPLYPLSLFLSPLSLPLPPLSLPLPPSRSPSLPLPLSHFSPSILSCPPPIHHDDLMTSEVLINGDNSNLLFVFRCPAVGREVHWGLWPSAGHSHQWSGGYFM